MDNKLILLEKYIKVAVKKALREQEVQQAKAEKAMYLIHRFPGLKKAIVDLMSPAFGRYVAYINIIAPKPTTFKIGLINGQDFNIIYLGRNKFVAKVAGKKYYLSNLGESQRASQSVADILELNYAPAETEVTAQAKKGEELKADLAGTGPGGPAATSQPPEGMPDLGDDVTSASDTPDIPAPEGGEEEENPDELPK